MTVTSEVQRSTRSDFTATGAVDFHALRERVRRFLVRRVRDAHLAEDLALEVMVKLHVHRASLPAGDARRATAWALRAARNVAVDHFRASRRSHASLDSAPEPTAADADASARPASRELSGCVRRMMRRLPAPFREAVELADLHGRPQHLVARELGLSVSGAKSRVQRGRRQLRAMIDDCCDVELGRRGSVVSVAPTPRASDYCGSAAAQENACVQSRARSSTLVTGRGGRVPVQQEIVT
jgi:RNA polymerase sigma-70 factor (ECF subfamily)